MNKKLSELTTIDELKEFVGDDDLTEEEWVDLINYVLNNPAPRLKELKPENEEPPMDVPF